MSNPTASRRYSYFGQQGIGGGLTSENAIIVAQNKMTIADNVLIGTAPTRKKRGGNINWHTGSFQGTASFPAQGKPIRGLVEYWRNGGIGSSISDLFVHSDNKVWSMDERGTPAINRTGGLTLSTAGVPSYQVFNGELYFCSTANDHYAKWNGISTTAVSVTAPADGSGKYIVEHVGKMVMAGNNDFPFRVYYSSTFDPEIWDNTVPHDGGSFDLIDDGSPNGITGLSSFQNRLYVFTRTTIYEVSGTTVDTFSIQRVSNGIGCVGHASICQTPNDVIFCSDRGIHSLKQLDSGRVTTSAFLSADIQKLWTELINTALFDQICSTYDDLTNNVMITVPSSGQQSNDQVLCFNTEFGTWTVWPSINARCLNKTFINNKKNIISGGEDGTISLLNQNTKTDIDTEYTYRWRTGVLYPGGDMTVQRRYINCTLLLSSTTQGSVQVGWIIDGDKSGSTTIDLLTSEDTLGNTFVLGQSKLGIGQFTPKTVTIEDIGYGIQLEVIATGTMDVEVYGYILEAEDVNQSYR